MRFLLTFLLLLGEAFGLAVAPGWAGLTLKVQAGFGGYYRPHTLVPIAVTVQNTGDTLRGEFHVTASDDRALPYHYRFPATLAGGAHQLRFLYVTPENFSPQLTVEFVSNGQQIAAATDSHCQELYETDRLLAVVGGTGGSFNYLNSQAIDTGVYPVPRPWDISRDQQNYNRPYNGYRGPMPQTMMAPQGKGNVRLVYTDHTLLPDNPEGYGSVSMLALMSDMTENMLSADAQQAIPAWVSAGGHLLVAGGGVPSRLAAPFFSHLLPATGTTTSLKNVGTALTGDYGAGHVTRLSFDPDAARTVDWKSAGSFFGKLTALDPGMPLMLTLRDAINQTTMVRNLHPPSLTLIVIFLLIYLLLLVPVNYFWLKKIDKREMAWLTTPAIVLVFTVGAYGIGYMTKGHQLVLNMVSLVEAAAGQTTAETTDELLIFSPARASYHLSLGDSGLLLREAAAEQNPNGMPRNNEPNLAPLELTTTDEKIEVEHVAVNMWDFRQFVTSHRLDLGKGITANFTFSPGQMGVAPQRTGTITNNTPYNFPAAKLFRDGALVADCSLGRDQTINLASSLAVAPKPSWSPEKQSTCQTLLQSISGQISNTRLSHGLVLVAFTDETLCPVRLADHSPTSQLTALVVYLGGQAPPYIKQDEVPAPKPFIGMSPNIQFGRPMPVPPPPAPPVVQRR